MAEFSAADAAFTGFRVVRERPWAVGIWAALQFVVSLGLNLFIVATAGQAMLQLARIGLQPPTTDPGPALALIRQVAPAYVVIIIVSLVLSSVFYAAMNRAVMRPEESRFGYLRLAGDELRQLGLLALMGALFLGLYLGVVIVSVFLLTLIGLALGNGGPLGVGVLVVLMLPLILCALVFVGVRLSLASPLTFATGRVNLVAAWRLTRGRFWPMLGTYCIALALCLVVFALMLVIAIMAVGILSGGIEGLGALAQADTSSVASVLTPPRLIYLAITSIGAALGSSITMCPPAAIYRSIAGGGPGAVGKVFD